MDSQGQGGQEGGSQLSIPIAHLHRCCQVHDRCYGQLEEKHCAIRTQSYDYRFTKGLVICGKGGFPFRLGVLLSNRWACLYLVRQSEAEGHGAVAASLDFQEREVPV